MNNKGSTSTPTSHAPASNLVWDASIFHRGGPGAELDSNPLLWLPPVPVQVSFLGDAKSSLGDAESSLGDA